MSAEPQQNAPAARGGTGAGAAGATARTKPRAGVPVWRTGKPDAVLAAAVEPARAAVETIAPADQIGRHLAVKSEGDRLVTHLFEAKLAGYGGWQWYAVLTRNSRSKVVTVDELGLLPSEDSILAPEWVPWAERIRPGDEAGDDAAAAAATVPPQGAGDPDADGDAAAAFSDDYDTDEDSEADAADGPDTVPPAARD